jgi:hypothetical protein
VGRIEYTYNIDSLHYFMQYLTNIEFKIQYFKENFYYQV